MTEDTITQTEPKEIASTQVELPLIQSQLKSWCVDKLNEVRQSQAELQLAYEEAKAHKWKSSAIGSAAKRELQRVQFYEKMLAALEAGYMLFPPIDEVDVIAIRTNKERHPHRDDEHRAYSTPFNYLTTSELPPVGKGEYRDPVQRWQRWGTVTVSKKRDDGSTYQQKENNFRPLDVMGKPVFPLVMARVQCVNVTNAAMEKKLFDDIAIYPRRARKDPVILGRIHDPHDPNTRRVFNFLISWRVDKRDL